ncbi:hypothetical protein E2C01_034553 [Portunus trituberculatus]|uniref:Uncharacterized protein n=1 Tax=Portunus trituberculatus TaxID=210409 RepID=A0A5B7F5X8_PORTR|nr:hypothetical protein [Portunus trituberculatus]
MMGNNLFMSEDPHHVFTVHEGGSYFSSAGWREILLKSCTLLPQTQSGGGSIRTKPLTRMLHCGLDC